MPRKLSSIEKKVRSIEQEKKRVERDIRRLSKALSNPKPIGSLDVPDARAQKKRKPAAALASRQSQGTKPGKTSAGTASGKKAPKHVLEVNAATSERFSSYLAGSLTSTQPLKQQQSVQRNKAIFMLIFVFLVAFVVIRLLFK